MPRANYTYAEIWTVEDLVDAIMKTVPDKKKRINIPKFQRTLVWTMQQKKMLISSIKQWFPIGSILLYKQQKQDWHGNTVYNLIDWLQRSTTLKQYTLNPTDFFDNETDLYTEIIWPVHEYLLSVGKDMTEDNLKRIISLWMSTVGGFEESKGFSSFWVASYLNQELELELSSSELSWLVSAFFKPLQRIREDADIQQAQVSVLIFSGDSTNLPAIFERLNSKGTQLSKYQIYAATWMNYAPIKIDNEDVVEKIRAKYEKLLENGYEIENYDADPRKFNVSDFSYFEYLFWLGKVLAEKYPYLFSQTTSSDQEDSSSFNIANLCVNKPFSEMDNLPKDLQKLSLRDLENCIFEAVDIVNTTLKPCIALKMNSRGRIPLAHTEYQIASIIWKVFHSKWNTDLTQRADWKEMHEKLRRNLPFHYLYDIIQEDWRGSGDSKAFNLIHSDRYERDINRKDWEWLLDGWFKTELDRNERGRPSANPKSGLFLKYIYRHVMSIYEEVSEQTFDIEHLIPVDRLKEIAGDGGIPIGAFPNLCLLDKGLNRKKGNKTFYEHFDELVANGELTVWQAEQQIAKIERYTFTVREDLEFVRNSDTFTVENYKIFLENRYRKVKEKFFETNNID